MRDTTDVPSRFSLWERLSPPWQACLEQAVGAMRAGNLAIGSVVVDGTGEIVGRGDNRLRESGTRRDVITGTPLAHAEVYAIADAEREKHAGRVLDLYTTVEPCPLCTGAVVMGPIRSIHFASYDPWAGATTLLRGSAYTRGKAISVIRPDDSELADLCTAFHVLSLLLAFPEVERTPGATMNEVMSALGHASPMGVELGYTIARDADVLKPIRDAGVNPATAVGIVVAAGELLTESSR